VDEHGVACEKSHLGKGLCGGHYAQKRRGEELRPLRAAGRVGCEFVSEHGVGCDQPHHCKGLCSRHYAQKRTKKKLEPLRETREECGFVDEGGVPCGEKHYAKDLCRRHYRQYSEGQELVPLALQRFGCDFVDESGIACDKPHAANGLCKGHDTQRQRGKELKSLKPPRGNACEFVDGDGVPCGRPHHAMGLCSSHRYQTLRGNKPTPLYTSKGGYSPENTGYFYFVAGKDWLKGGITNHVKRRLSEHKRQGLTEVLHLWEYADGTVPVDLERLWTERLATLPDTDRPEKHDLKDGYTESIRRTVELEQWIEEVFKPLADDLLAAPLAA